MDTDINIMHLPIAYDIRSAAAAVSLSERTIRAAIKHGSLLAHYSGTKPLVLRVTLTMWAENLPTDPVKPRK